MEKKCGIVQEVDDDDEASEVTSNLDFRTHLRPTNLKPLSKNGEGKIKSHPSIGRALSDR